MIAPAPLIVSVPAEFVAVVEGRIAAIAHAHTLLAETGWKSVGLRLLLERSLAPHDLDRIHLFEPVEPSAMAAEPGP